MIKFSKRGLSPIIATLLLIAVVVTLSAIVFIWAGRFIPEVVQKQGLPAEQACDNIVLSATYYRETSEGKTIAVTNSGNIPVYGMSLLVKSDGRSQRIDLEGSVMAGDSKKFTRGFDADGNPVSLSSLISESVKDMEIIPGILGEGETGRQKKVYKCENIIIPVEL